MSSDVCVVQVTGSGNMCADKIVGAIIHKPRPIIGSMSAQQTQHIDLINVGPLFCRVPFKFCTTASKRSNINMLQYLTIYLYALNGTRHRGIYFKITRQKHLIFRNLQ